MRRNDRARAIARVALCGATVLLPACYQGSEPLTPATPGSVDARLDGDWRCIRDDNDGTVGLSIRPRDASRHDVRLRAPGEEEDRYVAHVSRFGDTAIANVQELRDGQPAGQWVYVRYRFLREGVLDLSLVSDDSLKNAAHTLKIGRGPEAQAAGVPRVAAVSEVAAGAEQDDTRAALDEIRTRAADEHLYENLLVCVRARAPR